MGAGITAVGGDRIVIMVTGMPIITVIAMAFIPVIARVIARDTGQDMGLATDPELNPAGHQPSPSRPDPAAIYIKTPAIQRALPLPTNRQKRARQPVVKIIFMQTNKVTCIAKPIMAGRTEVITAGKNPYNNAPRITQGAAIISSNYSAVTSRANRAHNAASNLTARELAVAPVVVVVVVVVDAVNHYSG